MKLVHPYIEHHILFEETSFNGLVVENKQFFYRLVNDLYLQTNGKNGEFVLSENNNPIEISKSLELIQGFIPFDLNTKSLINKVCSAIENAAVNESFYMKTQEMISYLQKYFLDIFIDFSPDLECTKLNISSIVKSVGISICTDTISPIEKVLNYMELVREFDKDKVFAFINMKSYFSTDELNIFVSDALNRKFKFFMLDSFDNELLSKENKIIIDNDLCEI